MNEFFSQFFGKNKDTTLAETKIDEPSEEKIPEALQQRKIRIAEHLDNIQRYQEGLDSLQILDLPFKKKGLIEGGFTASQILLGLVAVPSGLVLREKIDPQFGAVVSYQGAQMMSRGLLKLAQYLRPVSKREVERRQTTKKKKRQAEGMELVSEASMREKMSEIVEATLQRRVAHRRYEKARKLARQEGLISEVPTAQEREEHLRKTISYLDELLHGQAAVVGRDMPLPKGLIEFSKTIKDYYQGLLIPHKEQRDAFAILGATGVLLGAELKFGTHTSLQETVAALTSGILHHFIEFVERRGKKRNVQQYIEDIDKEIGALKQRRLETVMKLQRLEERGIGKEQKKVAEKESPDQEVQDREDAPLSIEDVLRQWQEMVRGIVASAPQGGMAQEEVTATAVPLSTKTMVQGALAGFLGVTIPIASSPHHELPPQEEEEVTQPAVTVQQRQEPAVKPLDRRTLVELTALPSIDRKIVHDIVMLIKQDPSVIPESVFTGDAQVVIAKFESIANDPSVTAEELEDVVNYLEQMDTTLRANQSILEFRSGHLRIILENKSKIEEALERRERETAAHALKMMPSTMRSFLLLRYRISDVGAGEEIDQDIFERRLRAWMQSDRIRERDRNPLRRFFELCERELQQLPTLYGRSEKELIVRRSLSILREHVSDAPFSPARNMQFREERLTALEPIVAAYVTERDQNKIPGIGMKERLMYESSFIPSDDIYAISFDHKKEEKDMGLRNISTAAIIGSYISSAAEGSRRNWLRSHAEDPELREDQEVMDLSSRLVSQDATLETTYDEFFFDTKSGRERIEVWRIPGVAGHGPMFFVMKGIKYVTAAKIAGLPRIVARVREVRQPNQAMPLEIVVSDINRYAQLRKLKDAGFIEGDFADRLDIHETSSYAAKIRKQVFPWSIWFSERNIQTLCSIYNALYPQAFDHLYTVRNEPIVRDALLKDFPTFYSYIAKKRSNAG
ncbi:MAG: hypothetical protein Q8P56_00715 [Candidatus Uhrbacteria bacterium]|nr:hypothetical protein [Candidatus Uhrbacteria bacterium]